MSRDGLRALPPTAQDPELDLFSDVERRGDGPYACPCCGHLTLPARGWSDICPVCGWEDDGQDEHDASIVRGGPNGDLSLLQGRENVRLCGASSPARTHLVRDPEPAEIPIEGVQR